ncbi:MAG: hypothetical protein ABI540_08945 [Spartobacteria bacterium]
MDNGAGRGGLLHSPKATPEVEFAQEGTGFGTDERLRSSLTTLCLPSRESENEMSKDASKEDLEVYLRDHYAGGVGALDLLEHLIKAHQDDALGLFFTRLRGEIEADHRQLHNLMEALGFAESSLRNAGAWVAEKLGRAKVGFTSGEEERLRHLQSLETLLVGITGKKLLWRALLAAQGSFPVLQRIDLELLEKRAIEQADRVEKERLEAAQAAFLRS